MSWALFTIKTAFARSSRTADWGWQVRLLLSWAISEVYGPGLVSVTWRHQTLTWWLIGCHILSRESWGIIPYQTNRPGQAGQPDHVNQQPDRSTCWWSGGSPSTSVAWTIAYWVVCSGRQHGTAGRCAVWIAFRRRGLACWFNTAATVKPKGIFGGHLNIRSLMPKRDEIRTLLVDSNVDFLCLSETWLHGNILTTMIEVPGYKCFRKDRAVGRGGG